jgi:rhodanese-related sulfurtransferase
MTGYKTINAEQLARAAPKNGIVLDVRSRMEHDEKRLKCAHVLVPLDELDPADFMTRHGLNGDSEIYILCRSGKRAAQAAEKFAEAGSRNVYVIEGGLMACENYGLETEG